MLLNNAENITIAFFNSISQGCLVYSLVRDESGQIVDWIVDSVNHVAASVMGLVPEQMIGQSANAMFGSDIFAPYLKMSIDVMTSGNSQQHEIYFPISNQYFLSTLFRLDNNHIGNTNLDITERILLEKHRDLLSQRVCHKNQDLEEVIRIHSHDLRSPLISLHGFTDALMDSIALIKQLNQDSEHHHIIKDMEKFIHLISKTAVRLDAVSSGILRFAKLGRSVMDLVPVSAKKVVSIIFMTEQERLVPINAQLEIGDLPDCIGDSCMLMQVFSNLIENCIKYRDPERPLRISVSGRIEDGISIYEIMDNGQGIEPKFRESVFNLYHRINPHGTIPGEGVGLAIVKRSTVLMNGSVTIDDGAGNEGVKFTVCIPAISTLSPNPKMLAQ